MQPNPRNFFFLLLCFMLLGPTHAITQNLTLQGAAFYLDGQPFDMWGVRVASASQQEEYTRSLIANLDDYKAAGINTISVYIQGSSGGYADPFNEKGNRIDPGHLDRLTRIVEACAGRDMVVIAGIFYQRTLRDEKLRRINSKKAVYRAVRTTARALRSYDNVIINIANEQNSGYYKGFEPFDFNRAENIIDLCRVVKKTHPDRLVGGGGYNDSLNIVIGKSPIVDVLLFDTFSGDIEEGQHSGWHYDHFRAQDVPDKPLVNVEIFGGWTKKFMPPGVYPPEGKEIHWQEVQEAKNRPGLYVHLHANPWFQAADQGLENRFDLGGQGTPDDPGVRWFFDRIRH